MISEYDFHTLEEWIPLLANIKVKKYRMNTYGNYWNDGSLKSLIGSFDEEDEKFKKSKVVNVELNYNLNTVIIDVGYIRFYKDSKDDIIAHLWEKLYLNKSQLGKMELMFNTLTVCSDLKVLRCLD